MAENNKFADEIMSDDELDDVSGGSMSETVSDSVFLYNHGLVEDYHDGLHMTFHWESDSAEVDAGWAKAGITCVTKWFNFNNNYNQYFINGKEISRDEAYKIVESKFKKIHYA